MITADNLIRDPAGSIRKWRKDNDLTLAQVAKVLPCSIGHLNDIEMNRSNPSVKLMREILFWGQRPEQIKKIWNAKK
ncbi:MAG TPA: helix-turn-helix transcriptional regulator [Bellilinea sp.]|nr:helix-turn-helix transcriptional regulator [Bellilinea sp.]